MTSFDVCVVGHITQDLIEMPGRQPEWRPGGGAYYAGIAYARLGLPTLVITKANVRGEAETLETLREMGAEVRCLASEETTRFENAYSADPMAPRRQRLLARAAPITAADIAGPKARAYHFAPLSPGDISLDLWRLAPRPGLTALDAQGMVRLCREDGIELMDWAGKTEVLNDVDVLKVSGREATVLTGTIDPARAAKALRRFGSSEVLVTLGGEGAVVAYAGGILRVPSYRTESLADATGCGDSFLAGYLACRLWGTSVKDAAHFASALASLKAERIGAFSGCRRDVEERLRAAEGA